MKFAKELEDDLVPEWRAKYINYKQGKKKIKAISKVLRSANRIPKDADRPELSHVSSSASIPYTYYDFNARVVGKENGSTAIRAQYANMRKMSATLFTTSPPMDRRAGSKGSTDDENNDDDSEMSQQGELTPLNQTPGTGQTNSKSYGSFRLPLKDVSNEQNSNTSEAMPKFTLPRPALHPGRESNHAQNTQTLQSQRSHLKRNGAPQVGDGNRLAQSPNSPSSRISARDSFRRTFQPRDIDGPEVSEEQQQAYNELDARQDDFFNFLDTELEKVERFYRNKEDGAQDRLNKLRAQLHEHRNQRARDMKLQRQGKSHLIRQDGDLSQMLTETPLPNMPVKELGKEVQNGILFRKVFHPNPDIGKTSKAMDKLASPPASPHTKAKEAARDYTKKRPALGNDNVPHKFAKRRLKLALQEFYRGMELLKSYAILNKNGFRKINKKYDKAVNARPPLRYFNEKVNDAHFAKSTFVDEYLVAVEDLYARYFERGNRKVAVKKLQSRLQEGDHTGSTFRNGLNLAAGACFGVAGLYNAIGHLFSDNPTTSVMTAYLLQMYGGYFLALLLFLLFILNCKIWTVSRINYVFVFEYDTRHVLDWRQLAELPCFFLFLNGLFLWLNFAFGDSYGMYTYWPAILYGITLIIVALPFKVLYYHSRKWWGFSNFRILFAGLYPVEFRDFFLGDMYCSETYFMSQIVVFFCVYRFNWEDPPQCNSKHSMLLGFFTCLPAIWRFSQCIRRYVDSGNWFPHLANAAKYLGNILYYMTLSLYRLHVHSNVQTRYKIAFLLFAALNGIYCSFWDVAMDWSLGNFHAKHRGLRDQLAYRRVWIYYAAILSNTVLRQQWILYGIFVEDLQHSAGMSFFVGLAEVLRRGVWISFRVENEHTTNVASFRASRDIPLPYSQDRSPQVLAQDENANDFTRRRKNAVSTDAEDTSPLLTGSDRDLEGQTTSDVNASSTTNRRTSSANLTFRALARVGTAIAQAHSQDFQKRRRPEVVGDSAHDEDTFGDQHADSSEAEDDPHDGSEGNVRGNYNNTDSDVRCEEDEHHEQEVQKQRTKRPRHKDGSEDDVHDDDGSDGHVVDVISSDSDAGGAGEDLEMQSDVEEVKKLAKGNDAAAGLRGGAKKNGESSKEGKKQRR